MGAARLLFSLSLGVVACGQEPPPSRIVIESAEQVLYRQRFDIDAACNTKDDSYVIYQREWITGRGAYNHEDDFWPATVRIAGQFKCIRNGFPAWYRFVAIAEVQVTRDDSAETSVGGEARILSADRLPAPWLRTEGK